MCAELHQLKQYVIQGRCSKTNVQCTRIPNQFAMICGIEKPLNLRGQQSVLIGAQSRSYLEHTGPLLDECMHL